MGKCVDTNVLKSTSINNIVKGMTEIKVRDFKGFNGFSATLTKCPSKMKGTIDYGVDLCSHEWLEHKDMVKPFYDVDLNLASKDDWEQQIPILQEKWTTLLQEKYEYGDIAISSCHRRKEDRELGKQKKGLNWFISFHFVVNNYQIRMGNLERHNAQLGFWDPTKSGKDKILVEGYDNSVYSDGQNMRMLYQTKPNSTPVPKCPVNFVDRPQKHTIQLFEVFGDTDSYVAQTELLKLKDPPKQVVAQTKISQKPTKKSPPVLPTTTVISEPEHNDHVLESEPYDGTKLESIVLRITSRYEYEDWLKVIFGVYNVTSGDGFGLELVHEWSALDSAYDKSFLDNEWKWLDKKSSAKTNKIGIATLVKWAEMDNPTNIFKCIYLKNVQLDEKGKPTEDSVPNTSELVDKLNEELMFVKETGEYIILDQNKDGTPCWFLKGVQKVSDHYNKYSFKDPFTQRKTNPFKLWCENIRRREVMRIGFNPENSNDPDIFNLWKGFAISRSDCEHTDVSQCQPILDHIKHIWCKGDEEIYNYVTSYYAHIIQKPHKKSGVVLCIKSKQGAGKGVVMDALSNIIGKNHYKQVSNANQIFGDFNGMLEACVLADLDEAIWGGDKKLEGMIKNRITEKKQIINKKNKEAYTIDDYCNYNITTNNDRFAPVSSPEDRRHYCIECDNKYSGRVNTEITEYFKPILEIAENPDKLKSFAKYLYTKNISDFNPRVFNKTPLLQEQVQHSWNSVQKWWFAVLNDGGFDCDKAKHGFCVWNKHYRYPQKHPDDPSIDLTGMRRTQYAKDKNGKRIYNGYDGYQIKKQQILYYKDFLYDCYAKTAGSGYNKMDKNAFFRSLKQDCLDSLLDEVRPKGNDDGKRVSYIVLPIIEECQDMFNKIQGFNYKYQEDEDEDWDSDVESDLNSDSEGA
jgi:hypothetical protein